ncbi:MAG: acyl-CoA thioesterase [Chlamydiia bacterium]|nr:acyl-CoA thioesterase [Chlamydiia bacterium]MCP5508983.1 acyl-CoA thioesterase [Chlamydiales bacterium]
MKGKTPSETEIKDHTYKVFPNDLNSKGTAFGGMVMSILDRLAAVVAERHSAQTCVTASVDSMHFLAPAHRGDHLIFMVAVNRAWNTSMEIGAKVIAEDPRSGKRRHMVSVYFTFVAIDENEKPTAIPPLIPETPAEKRRFEEAQIRRERRKAEATETAARRSKEK